MAHPPHCICPDSAKRVHFLGIGDQNVATSLHGGIERDFEEWEKNFWAEVTAIRGKS